MDSTNSSIFEKQYIFDTSDENIIEWDGHYGGYRVKGKAGQADLIIRNSQTKEILFTLDVEVID